MKVDFSKNDGLVPVIIQHVYTDQVLMLGYMNQEALDKTESEGKVTFYSRSKKRLWTKGEESKNYLYLKEISVDCDNDTLLIKALLESTIEQRIADGSGKSYTSSLFKRGVNKVAQKVGEEAVELVIESKDDNLDLFKNEAADLLYHFLILLKTKDLKLKDIEKILEERSK